MPFLEIYRNGRLFRRQEIDEARSKNGLRVRLGKEVVQVKPDEPTIFEDWEAKIVLTPTADLTTPAAATPEPTPTLPGYELLDKIGEGGMGVVWKAIQLGTKRRVAIKFLGTRAFGSERARHRFEREVELSAKLEHPNIARIYDSGLHHGVYYYAMELIHGLPLDQFAMERKLDQKQTLQLISIICTAVQHAHDRGVIHRDLKPGNILISTDGQPHVLDFGLAKSLLTEEGEKQVTISTEGSVSGTPAYMSPEQASGKQNQIDARSDVYSLGVMLYRLLVGKPPHDLSGSQFEVMRRIVEEEIRPPRQQNVSIDGDLEAVLFKALAQNPANRYASTADFAADIESYLRGETLTARRRTPLYVLGKRLKHYRVPLAFAASLLAVVVALGVLPGGWLRRKSPDAPAASSASVVASASPAPLATTQNSSLPTQSDAIALKAQVDAAWSKITNLNAFQGVGAKIEAAKNDRVAAQALLDRNAYPEAAAGFQKLLSAMADIQAIDSARSQASAIRHHWSAVAATAAALRDGGYGASLPASLTQAPSIDEQASGKFEAGDFAGAQALWQQLSNEHTQPVFEASMKIARDYYDKKLCLHAYNLVNLARAIYPQNASVEGLRNELLGNDHDGYLASQLLDRALPQIRFDDVGLSDVVDFLRDVSGGNIFVNWTALERAGVSRKTPVKLDVRDVPLRKVLRLVLDSLGAKVPLDFTFVDGVAEISTADDVKNLIRTGSYDVTDMLNSSGAITADEQMKKIAELIEGTVAPETWKDHGGKPGEVRVLNTILNITQSPENLRSVDSFLENLRFRRMNGEQSASTTSPTAANQEARSSQIINFVADDAQIVADLGRDWSDSDNPHNGWSYREGTNNLPAVPNWTPLNQGFAQPALAPSINGGHFLPAWFKAAGTPNEDADWQQGDMVVHTTDAGNGRGNGIANVTWTSNFTGPVNIDGSVWNGALHRGRSNAYRLLVNGTAKSSGDLLSGDGHTRSAPLVFAVHNVAIAAKGIIEFQVIATSVRGDFTGVSLTISRAEGGNAVAKPAMVQSQAVTADAASRKQITNSLGMKFVEIKPGSFLMGSPESDNMKRPEDTPQHKVTLTKPFYMGITDVTVQQFQAFVSASGYRTDAEKRGWGTYESGGTAKPIAGRDWKNPGYNVGPDYPVAAVTWDDAKRFCDWLSTKDGRHVRLPTEAEWEYACRAGTTTIYQWGDDPAGGAGWCNVSDLSLKEALAPGLSVPGINSKGACDWRDGFAFASPVARFRPNAWGLYDMHGNLWEWCSDWYAADYYKKGDSVDPQGPGTGIKRAIRGGCFDEAPRFFRSASRLGVPPDIADFGVGFRVVIDADANGTVPADAHEASPKTSASIGNSQPELTNPPAIDINTLKQGLYLHFDLSTFTGYNTKAPDFGRTSPTLFAPTNLDVNQWVNVAKQSGMTFAILTAKHETGFCLWPSQTTDYTIAASPVKSDIVGSFITACKIAGIIPGIHYSIPDAHDEGKVLYRPRIGPKHYELVKSQITELHKNYPDIRIQIIDAIGRLSPEQAAELRDIVHRLNPKCLFLADPAVFTKDLTLYTSDSINDNWMWAPGAPLTPASTLFAHYTQAQANHRPYLLNAGIDRTGQIPQNEIDVLHQMKQLVAARAQTAAPSE